MFAVVYKKNRGVCIFIQPRSWVSHLPVGDLVRGFHGRELAQTKHVFGKERGKIVTGTSDFSASKSNQVALAISF